MKNIKYILAMLIAISTFSCIEDEAIEIETTEPEGGVIVLNEIMSNNVGDGVDWIEIYNAGSEAVDLGGYMLNDAMDPAGGWAIPSGTMIEAGGYIVFKEDNDWDFGGVSSSGEWVSFADATGTLIEKIEVPDMSANAGLTYAKEIDGGEVWIISSPTKGAMNGDVVNTAPILEASGLTELDRVYSVSASDADGISSVKLVYMVNEGVTSLDMSLVDGEYKTSVPLAKVGDVVKYYIKATDNTGLSTIYPEGGTENPGEFTVVGGVEEVSFSEVFDAGANTYNFSFTANVYYADQVDEVRLYYLLPGEAQDDVNDDKHSIKDVPEISEGVYKATIEGLAKSTELRYYMRVEYIDGTKTYYPMESYDTEGTVTSEFNHDLGTTWPTVTVGEIPIDPVNGFSELTITNEAATDLTFNVKVEYDNGAPEEVKFYYIINYDAATYVEDNDRHSIEWDGDLPTADNMYNFVIPVADLSANDEISWYMRAKDGNGDKMYYTYGKTADEFDGDIKDDPATWHVVTKN